MRTNLYEGGVAGKEAYTVHAINIISQQQYFVADCICSYVAYDFGLCSICDCFPSTCKPRTQAKCIVWSQLWYHATFQLLKV
jgi:hypothetical protein